MKSRPTCKECEKQLEQEIYSLRLDRGIGSHISIFALVRLRCEDMRHKNLCPKDVYINDLERKVKK